LDHPLWRLPVRVIGVALGGDVAAFAVGGCQARCCLVHAFLARRWAPGRRMIRRFSRWPILGRWRGAG